MNSYNNNTITIAYVGTIISVNIDYIKSSNTVLAVVPAPPFALIRKRLDGLSTNEKAIRLAEIISACIASPI